MSIYKGYDVSPDKQYPSNYRIKNATKGGSLPLAFDGLFTDRAAANRVIDAYTERSNAKTVAKSGS